MGAPRSRHTAFVTAGSHEAMASSDRDPPPRIEDVEELEDLLSEPTEEVVETFRRVPGDLLVIGAGGKMGPSLCRMARRAADIAEDGRRVIAVSRFTRPDLEDDLRRHGIETVACDVLEHRELSRLPDVPNVLYMAGRKFGTAGGGALTWVMNTVAPSLVAERFASSRIVAFSSGNVYGMTPVDGPGSREEDRPAPVGEYAMSVLGRERVLEHASRTRRTPAAILRLNYAVEMRYGVLVDLARKVLRDEAVDVAMGWVNVVWQGDANALALRALEHASVPPALVNIAGPALRVREVSEELARLLGRTARFAGEEAPDALLSDGSRGRELLGAPRVEPDRLIAWTADWVRRGKPTFELPTHFEERGGDF